MKKSFYQLGLLFIVFLSILFISSNTSLFNSSQTDYQKLIEKGAVLIDVRTVQEFTQGHAKGSQNIPLHNLKKHINSFEGKVIIVVCHSGGRAEQAVKMLTKHKITAYNAGTWKNFKQK